METITRPSTEFKSIIQATFPNYRRRKVFIIPAEKITFRNLNWAGGTRAGYHACTLTGKSIPSTVDMSRPAPWNNPYEGGQCTIPPDVAVVEGGFFCGKEFILRIYVNPVNLPLMLKAGL